MNLLVSAYTKLYGSGSVGFHQIGPQHSTAIHLCAPSTAPAGEEREIDNSKEDIGADEVVSDSTGSSVSAKPTLNETRLLRALKQETSRLRKANALLLEEPRKSREGLVLLSLGLTSVYLMVNFALFMMAEETFTQLYRSSSTLLTEAQVKEGASVNRKFKVTRFEP